MALVAGCTALPAQGPPTASTNQNFHLYVSNQSAHQPQIDVIVKVDGLKLFEGPLETENHHNWVLRESLLAEGNHTIEAFEAEGGTRAATEFLLPASGQRWVVVSYYSSPTEEPVLTIEVSEKQVIFS